MAGPQRNARTSRHETAPRGQRSRSPSPVPPQATRGRPTEEQELDSDRSPLPTTARQLTRMIAMFWNIRPVLRADAQIQEATDNGSIDTLRATASKAEKLNFELYDELNRLQPDLFELLATKDNSFMRNVRHKLADGRSGAKAEDNNKVKNALPHMRDWSPPLLHEPKSKRGLAHLECAYRLSPIIVDWDDPEQRRQFLECGKPPMIAKYWPRVLYRDGTGNRAKPSEGLCEAKILLDVSGLYLQCFGPVDSHHPSDGQDNLGVTVSSSTFHSLAARSSKARPQGDRVKVRVEPSTGSQLDPKLRFALSAEEVFSDDGGTFNYIQFYTELRDYLERPKFKSRADALITHWNKTLFPNPVYTDNNVGGEDDDNDGMLALLEAEVDAEGDSEGED
ncbi:hypothetical protein FRC08_005576 [Ceratobasidium sp. 394]|nr:hypothetical protein FRC08_005576 [Ceratobasidium sp. 394]KAG9096582.1 hypothetical protein FS749_008160 [Ceratobasidium sp. UAMH 11750]